MRTPISAATLCHDMREHTIQANDREPQRHSAEHRHHSGQHPLVAKRRVQDIWRNTTGAGDDK